MPYLMVDGCRVHVRVARGAVITDRDRAAVADCVRAMHKANANALNTASSGVEYGHHTYGDASVTLSGDPDGVALSNAPVPPGLHEHVAIGLGLAPHAGGCSNFNALDPQGRYKGVEECGCRGVDPPC